MPAPQGKVQVSSGLAACYVNMLARPLLPMPNATSKHPGFCAAAMQNGVIFGNGKAANAGGVAVSGLEMSQNRIGKGMPRTRGRTCRPARQ